MIVYRLSKEIYASDLSGKGAEIAGGRWNSKGNAALYTAQSIALCVTEIAVHIPLGILPRDYCLVHIEIPDVDLFEPKRLPKDWNTFPHPDSTQKIGDKFLKENKFLIMKVPSAAVQGEFNYVINPRNIGSSEIKVKKIEKFTFDDRLFIR
ncbi:RES family NAD+ phosphorylase [Epilithonimonas hungarica]|uniref:RES domain-containing protein n=1 Tax=Epilithonimonas hungarica TaxID=454006 RepID=A0A1G7RBK6_9FLAO|nr:RES family NAD+ phosphorylase [Epilithonimonas hungarica]SDG08015.1 RES domain-containing protein [Epilithonimonas hungarica]